MAEILLKFKTYGGHCETVPLSQLALLFNVTQEIIDISLCVEENGTEIAASIDPRNQDYPGITIDGRDANNETIWLANVELPNESYSKAITARLYAGYEATETDSPIAIVKTSLMTREEIDALSAQTKPPKKYVHVDTDAADMREWTEGEDELTERVPECDSV